jgi:hypothetical protein
VVTADFWVTAAAFAGTVGKQVTASTMTSSREMIRFFINLLLSLVFTGLLRYDYYSDKEIFVKLMLKNGKKAKEGGKVDKNNKKVYTAIIGLLWGYSIK